MCFVALLILLLCLSACGNKLEAVEPEEAVSTAENVEETEDNKSTEEIETTAKTEPQEVEPLETDTADLPEETEPSSSADEIEAADETALQDINKTECNETVYTNRTSNIRQQPTTSSEKVGSVPVNTELVRTGILDNGWSEIQYEGNVCYISSKLLGSEPVVEAKTEPAPAESATTPVTPTAPESPVTPETPKTAGVAIGTTKTFSTGDTFEVIGTTPGGLPIWCLQGDEGMWPDYMIAAYDATGITNDMSDYDKAVAINNYICSVVDYAYETGVDDRALYCACLSYGKANCTGYAHAFDCLCTMAGVWSNQVGGLAGGNTHSWNYVLIDGTKYWVDVTWNDTGSTTNYLMSTSLWDSHQYSYEKTW